MGMYLDNVRWMHLMAHCGVSFLDTFDTENGLMLFEMSPNVLQNDVYKIHYQGTKASLLMVHGSFDEAKALYELNI